MNQIETGENYSLNDCKITLKNAIKRLEAGDKIEGEAITGLQIKNAMKIIVNYLENEGDEE